MKPTDDVGWLKELMEARFEAQDVANRLAYVELQRRLDTLNHAHENMVRDREMYLPKLEHDRFYTEYKDWRDIVNATLANWSGRMFASIFILGAVFTVVQVLLKFVK